MFQELIAPLQSTVSSLWLVLQNQWLVLAVGSLVFTFVVRFLLGPVRGQEMAGFAIAPILCGLMVIVIGQTLFMQPAPGNTWRFVWSWRIDQLILLFAAIGWLVGLLVDVMRRPFALAMFFGLLIGLGLCASLIVLLQGQSASLPETFSKTVAFALVSLFVVWRHAQSENGYSVLRVGQLALASLGLMIVAIIIDWSDLEATISKLFALVLVPAFAIAWLMWTSVGRGSNMGAVGLFGGLAPFLLLLGHQTFVADSLSITAASLVVLILVGPDFVSGFERRRNVSDRVPFISGLLYLMLIFVLYVALVFTAGLDARS